jgi:hypothetical protein
MEVMKSGDLVKIIKESTTQIANVLGFVCILDDVVEPHAIVTVLRLDGVATGSGLVTLDCLEPEDAPSWLQAKNLYDSRRVDICQASEARIRIAKWKARVAEVAQQFSVTPAVVQAIYELLESFARSFDS